MNPKGYLKTFFIPELNAILYRWWLLLILVLILAMALWSIGFSRGTSQVLAERMNSPFVRFLPIPIPAQKQYENKNLQQELRQFLSDTVRQNTFHYRKYFFVPYVYDDFKNRHEGISKAKIRKIDPQNSLYNFITDPQQDLLVSRRYVNLAEASWSVIVTDDYLQELGYTSREDYPAFLHYIFTSQGKTYTTVALPIAYVVKQLPNQFDVFMPPKLYYTIRRRYDADVLDPNQSAYAGIERYFIPGKAAVLKNKLKDVLPDIGGELQRAEDIHRKGVYLTFSADEQAGVEKLRQVLPDVEPVAINDYNLPALGALRNLRDDFLVIEFEDMSRVEGLVKTILDTFDLRADMASVESMKNFTIFDIIAKVLAAVLITFAIVFLVYSLSRVLLEHIERNAQSLGTLKAFGLSNQTITLTYGGIALIFVFIVFLGAFISTALLGDWVANQLTSDTIKAYLQGASLFALRLDLTILGGFILLPISIIVFMIFYKLQSKSPGELIYKR